MFFIGIDPGQSGGIAFISDSGWPEVFDMPLLPNGEIDVVDLKILFRNIPDGPGHDTMAIIEKAQPMPDQGVTSVFRYGAGYGSLITALRLGRIPLNEVRPQKWKKEFSLKNSKIDSVTTAMKLFPMLKFEDFHTARGRLLDGRAEALLIAEYGRRLYGRGESTEDADNN